MIPTAKHSHTAILLTYKNENILIDCGEGTQRQFKIAKISPSKLTRILLTHWHGDHILGLPGLFQTLGMNDYRKTLNIYGPRRTKHFLSLLRELVNISIPIETHEVSNKVFEIRSPQRADEFRGRASKSESNSVFETQDFIIQALPMTHGTPTLAYSFAIKTKLRLNKAKLKKLKIPHGPHMKQLQQGKSIKLNGKTINPKQVAYNEPGKKVTIILDTSPNPNTIKIAKDSDILICEASYTQKEKALAKDRHHLTAKDAATIAKKSNSKQLILTHLSQRYEHNTPPIESEAKKIFKNTRIVKDLDTIEL